MRCWPAASGRNPPRRGDGAQVRPGRGSGRAGFPGTAGGVAFIRVWRAADDQQEGSVDASVTITLASVARLALVLEPRGELLRPGDDEVRVHQAERLQRDRRGEAASASRDDRGSVEHLEQAGDLGAALLEIDRTAGRAGGRFIDDDLTGIVAIGRYIRALPGGHRARR